MCNRKVNPDKTVEKANKRKESFYCHTKLRFCNVMIDYVAYLFIKVTEQVLEFIFLEESSFSKHCA